MASVVASICKRELSNFTNHKKTGFVIFFNSYSMNIFLELEWAIVCLCNGCFLLSGCLLVRAWGFSARAASPSHPISDSNETHSHLGITVNIIIILSSIIINMSLHWLHFTLYLSRLTLLSDKIFLNNIIIKIDKTNSTIIVINIINTKSASCRLTSSTLLTPRLMNTHSHTENHTGKIKILAIAQTL